MIKFAIKRPSAANPKIVEWKTNDPVEGNTFVGVLYFDTKEEAEAVAAEWGGDTTIVEVNRPN